MPVQLNWKDETRTCLVYTFENKWTWEDFFQVWSQAHEFTVASPHKVHIIADFTHSSALPENVLSIARTVDKKLSSSMGMVIVVGTNAFLALMIELMRKTGIRAASQIYSVHTMDEAVQYLIDHRDQ